MFHSKALSKEIFLDDDDDDDDDDNDVIFVKQLPIKLTPGKNRLASPAYKNIFKDADYRVVGGGGTISLPSSNVTQSYVNYSEHKDSHTSAYHCKDIDYRSFSFNKADSKNKFAKPSNLGDTKKDVDYRLYKDENLLNDNSKNVTKIAQKRQARDEEWAEMESSVAPVNPINKKARFSQTFHSVQDILANKRALRERTTINDLNEKKKSAANSDCNRLFGKGFSPTISSPDKPNLADLSDISYKSQLDQNSFLSTLLSIDSSFLQSHIDCDSHINSCIAKNYHHFNPLKAFESLQKNQMPLSYESIEEYKSIYTPMIIYDTWAQIAESFQSSSSNTSKFDLVKNYSEVEEQDFFYITLKGSLSNINILEGKHLIENWIVTLVPKISVKGDQSNVGRPKVTLGFVTEVKVIETANSVDSYMVGGQSHSPMTKTTVRFVIKVAKASACDQNKCISLKSQQLITLQALFYLKPSLRLIETLTQMELRHKFFPSILKPDYDVCSLDTLNIPSFKMFEESRYNEFQKSAITGCYSAIMKPFSRNKVLLIQGPPGTGKTHTLVGIIKNIFANCPEDPEKPLRILICAPSNGAIDEIGRRLIHARSFLKQFKQRSLRLVRVGQRTQIHADVQSYLLDALIDKNLQISMQRKVGHEDYLRRSRIRDDLLLNADVILSTLSSCQQNCLDLFREKVSSKNALRCVIIDEASQCSEPEILMPLVYPSITKVVLIGDHLQLPATVISKKAKQMNFGRSLFERFFEYFRTQSSSSNSNLLRSTKSPVLTLCRQFRMHEQICKFPSEQFYEGRLETAPGAGINKRIRMQPFFVFDIINSKEKASNRNFTASKFNDTEVEFIFRLLLAIFRKLGYPVSEDGKAITLPGTLPVSIGVITFYRGQKKAITERLKNFAAGVILKHVDVNTVDAFQGQERDIVILSCVRAFDPTAGTASIGFLRSQQRMNVALTRAKSSLFICICGRSFADVPRWQKLLTDAQNSKRYFRITSRVPENVLDIKISI